MTDIAICLAIAFPVAAALYVVHVRIKIADNERKVAREWRSCAGSELDLLRELAKNHESRIAELEKSP